MLLSADIVGPASTGRSMRARQAAVKRRFGNDDNTGGLDSAYAYLHAPFYVQAAIFQ